MSIRDIVKEYGNQYEVVRAAAKKIGDPIETVWGTMVYGCSGDIRNTVMVPGQPPEMKGCGYEEVRELGIGVEGPPDLRVGNKFVPTPFFAGGCPECGGSMRHIDWNRDEAFEPRPRDKTLQAFTLPGKRKARSFTEAGYGGAELRPATEEADRG